MIYRAAIFDLDGTLLNTLDDIADSCNQVLKAAGFPTHPVPEYKNFVGRGIAYLVKAALPGNSLTDAAMEKLIKEMRAEYSKNCLQKTKPYPGVIETLAELSARAVRISILSNKPQDLVEFMVKELLSQFRFNTIMGVNNRFPCKPDPESTLYLVKQMKSPPEKTVFIGDSDIDILTAKNAGIDSIAVAWGFRPPDVLKSAGAEIIINRPGELLEFF
ncbi:MAG: HAD-IA family hydrolase [Spirochaetales bacterium]|nr:HAD-IA family hydrolase [Spirochaetales bacterium]